MSDKRVPRDLVLLDGEQLVEVSIEAVPGDSLEDGEPPEGAEVPYYAYPELGLMPGPDMLGPGAALLEHPETGELFAIHYRIHGGAIEILSPERYPDASHRPFLHLPGDEILRARQVA